MKTIPPQDLIRMEDYTDRHPIIIDLVYAKADHPDNIFKTAIYRPDASMWAHKLLAPVILRAADICFEKYSWKLKLNDCLRTKDAQENMVPHAHPDWLREPNRLLSPPGRGGHPRAMAIDLEPVSDKDGSLIDMGTRFDTLSANNEENRSHRDYLGFSEEILLNRRWLESALVTAAKEEDIGLLPLPQEWWDFRLEPDFYNQFVPLEDANLPEEMRLTS